MKFSFTQFLTTAYAVNLDQNLDLDLAQRQRSRVNNLIQRQSVSQQTLDTSSSATQTKSIDESEKDLKLIRSDFLQALSFDPDSESDVDKASSDKNTKVSLLQQSTSLSSLSSNSVSEPEPTISYFGPAKSIGIYKGPKSDNYSCRIKLMPKTLNLLQSSESADKDILNQLSMTDLGFTCVDSNGSAKKHYYGQNSFVALFGNPLKNNNSKFIRTEFNTKVSCNLCLSLDDDALQYGVNRERLKNEVSLLQSSIKSLSYELKGDLREQTNRLLAETKGIWRESEVVEKKVRDTAARIGGKEGDDVRGMEGL